MTTVTKKEARQRLDDLLDEVAISHEPIEIKDKRNSAVLISNADWRAIQETLYLTAIPGMRESIKEGLETPIESCSVKLEW